MPRSPLTLRTRRRGSLLIVGVVLGATACGSGHTGTGSSVLVGTESSTTSSTNQIVGGSAPSTDTPATQASGGSAGGPATLPTDTGPPADATAAPATPLTPGIYRYETNGQSSVSGGVTTGAPYPAITTLTADPPDGSAQHSTRDLRDNHGNGSVTETTDDYQADGVHLVHIKVTTTYAGITDVRDFQPSPTPLIAPTGAGPGSHVHFTMTGSGTTADVTIDVLRTETVDIGGMPINAFAVRTVTNLSGQVNGQTTSDTWVAPDHDLTLKEHVVTDATVGLNSVHSDYTATLQSVAPS